MWVSVCVLLLALPSSAPPLETSGQVSALHLDGSNCPGLSSRSTRTSCSARLLSGVASHADYLGLLLRPLHPPPPTPLARFLPLHLIFSAPAPPSAVASSKQRLQTCSSTALGGTRRNQQWGQNSGSVVNQGRSDLRFSAPTPEG